MSVTVPLSSLCSQQKRLIKTSTEIKAEDLDQHEEGSPSSYCFTCNQGMISIPMGLSHTLHLIPTLSHPPLPNRTFTGTLTEEQRQIVMRVIDRLTQREYGSCFLELATGKGKTCISVCTTVQIGLKTVFLCHLDSVCRQTVKEFAKFSDLKVQLVKNNRLDPEADLYIIGLRKAFNLWSKDRTLFRQIGLVIIDEAHLCTRFTFMELMFCFSPRYLLGMSATPVWNQMTELYFSDPIQVFATKPFVVKKLSTRFVPDTSKQIFYQGRKRIDWTNAMTSLAENPARNDYIVEVVIECCATHKTLVLGGRVYNKLVERGISSDLLVGRKSQYDPECQVLVGGVKKIGVGFNDPTRTALVLCYDLADVRQSEGRIRTSNNLVLDLVDCNGTLEKHWRMRKTWYLARGATVIEQSSKQPVPKESAGRVPPNPEQSLKEALFGR
jgi:hypothetical protein